MVTPTYTIPMGTLFASPLTASENLDDLTLQAGQDRITQADLARAEFDRIMASKFEPSSFTPAILDNTQLIPNAKPYSALSIRQAPSSDVGMMFSPELSRAAEMEYMQRRQAAMQNEALAFAQLTPMQQAQFGFYRGGQQLGDAIGGALGGKDPQLQMIGLQQQILSELDPSDPEQQLRVAQKYARTAPDLAMKIADNARKSAIQIRQASGASKLNVTAKVQEAEAYASKFGAEGTIEYNNAYKAYLQGSEKLPEKQSTGARVAEITRILSPETGGLLVRPSERAALEAELATYERPDKQLSLTSDRDAISAELFDNKPFAQITPAQKAIVNKRIEEEGRAKARESATVLPGVKGVGDLVGLRKNINDTLRPIRDAVNAAAQSIELADDVLKTGNFASAASLSRALAKASGETQLSKQDVAAFGGDPSFVGSISDIASRLGTGTPTADTTRKLRALAVLLKKKNEALEKNEIAQLQATARVSGLYTEDQIKQVFTLRGESKGKTRTTAGGISYTVDEEN
jgi:hypothetical protein